MNPRDALNRIKWDEGNERLEGVVIAYRHRGAPDDTAYLRAETIENVGRSFLDLPEGGRLPYHRILRIELRGRVVWDRRLHAGPAEPNS